MPAGVRAARGPGSRDHYARAPVVPEARQGRFPPVLSA